MSLDHSVPGTAHPRLERWLLALIILALVVGAAARMVALASKNVLFGDESVSYLVATGHQYEFADTIDQQKYPMGQWAPARDWQWFITPDEWAIFGEINDSLADYDIHPPLYFWLLHIWVQLVGVTVQSGALLNLAFDAATALVLVALGRRVLGNPRHALVAAALWWLSPVAIRTTLVARPYAAVTWLSILFAYVLYRAFFEDHARTPWRLYLLLTLTIAAGMLTNYFFAFPALAGGVAVLLRYGVRDRRRIIFLICCALVAFVLFFGMFPRFMDTVHGQRSRVEGESFSVEELKLRFESVETWPLVFFVDATVLDHVPRVVRQIALIAGMAVLAGLVVRVFRQKNDPPQIREHTIHAAVFLLTFALVVFLVPTAMYLGAVSMRATNKYRHLAPLWVFWPLVLMLVLRVSWLKRWQTQVQGVVVGVMLLSALGSTVMIVRNYRNNTGDPLDGSEQVLIDTTSRIDLFVAVINLQEDNAVFIGKPEYLVQHQDAWLPEVTQQHTIYIRIKEAERAVIDAIRATEAVRVTERRIVTKHGFAITPSSR
jgi:uncharacterized membrane protein